MIYDVLYINLRQGGGAALQWVPKPPIARLYEAIPRVKCACCYIYDDATRPVALPRGMLHPVATRLCERSARVVQRVAERLHLHEGSSGVSPARPGRTAMMRAGVHVRVSGEPSPGADVGRGEPSPGADMGRG